MNVVEIAEPRVAGQEVAFSWQVTPASALYERTGFRLRFPEGVDLQAVPNELWWRVALICLHAHWPLLRPCRIELPVRLPDGEAELWLRLTDAAVATLEAHAGGDDTERSIELAGSGPPLGPPPPLGRAGGAVSCFSGGRDSITQAAMLSELGEAPTLVTVTSPVAWSSEHDAPRRRQVLTELPRRRSLELVEVGSDLRGSWNNGFSAGRYGVAVNELSDALLYLATAVAVAAARGAPLVLMASEADVQENAKPGGMVVQSRHFMYSAATHAALGALLAPAGISIGSLTTSLRQFQVQRLLSKRYADLRDLQYSCWELAPGQAACSRCPECRGIALNLIADGISPAAAGIDLGELLLAQASWQPGDPNPAPGMDESLPRATAGQAHAMQELRCLAATPAERVDALLDGAQPQERRRVLEVYERLRASALAQDVEPEPGYRAGYLDLLPARLRDGVRAILDEHFEPAPPGSYEHMLANTRMLADWLCAPLRRAEAPALQDEPPRPPLAQPPQAVSLSDGELEPLRELIPAPEPQLGSTRDGRQLRVAETLLDGNELDYVTECVTSNWISSAGSFVPRLERAFAQAMGCRHAVACTSGTAALHLALAAAGVGPGDEVIVPAFTMIATASAARYVGARAVLADADPATWNLDPRLLRDKLSSRTRAVLPVHTYGQPADMDAIRDFAERNGLVVIEDAAEAHGARYKGRPVGSIGAVAAFSLYGNKIVTSGEGGMVTTNDDRIAAVARELRDHAFSRERHFWHRRPGFNYRMTNLQAAVGLAQTERIEELVARREEIARAYREELEGIEGLELPPRLDGGVTWMFGVTVNERFGIDRDELRRRLAARGVETRTFFVPLHLQPVLHRRFAGQRYPVAERLGRDGLYLPSGPTLSPEDVAYIGEALRSSREPALAGETPSSA